MLEATTAVLAHVVGRIYIYYIYISSIYIYIEADFLGVREGATP